MIARSTHQPSPALPEFFKGIALFTPGGDLVYCIDPNKRNRWHLQLCTALQEVLDLAEPPHFLVPCYTATLDRWFDRQTQQVRSVAEAYPLVLRHQAILNAVFGVEEVVWQTPPMPADLCDPIVLLTYHQKFPTLWQDHDLVMNVEHIHKFSHQAWQSLITSTETEDSSTPTGYVLRLFISGHTAATERTLQTLHQLLNQTLHCPYTLKVIDILKHPEQAEQDQISATPTLLRLWPKPMKRIVGELGEGQMISRLLGH